VRAMHQSVRCLAALVALRGLISNKARADAIYSVTNLGTANPSGNYLDGLSASQKAAFQAGSFDVDAHPATVSGLPEFHQGDIVRTDLLNGDIILSSPYLTTSNNVGMNAGTSVETLPNLPGFSATQLVVFEPAPHAVTVQDPLNPGSPVQVQSPGYLVSYFTNTSANNGQFSGTVAGINDHRVIATTQSNGAGIQAPYLQGAGGTNAGAIPLGNLGGANAVANALNNSNQVVGWSQIAGGAQHAFLYTNGAMQDLNSLIPSSAGFVLNSAVGISSAGEIVAYGADSSGRTHELLLTPLLAPVPEPSSLAVMSLAIVALAVYHLRGSRPRALAGMASRERE
jgi:probable HAF family extracellular repeat protein